VYEALALAPDVLTVLVGGACLFARLLEANVPTARRGEPLRCVVVLKPPDFFASRQPGSRRCLAQHKLNERFRQGRNSTRDKLWEHPAVHGRDPRSTHAPASSSVEGQDDAPCRTTMPPEKRVEAVFCS
jgi:hypothetical protein